MDTPGAAENLRPKYYSSVNQGGLRFDGQPTSATKRNTQRLARCQFSTPAAHVQPFRFSISVALHDSTAHSSAQTDAGISPLHASRGEHAHAGKAADMRKHLLLSPAVSGSPVSSCISSRGLWLLPRCKTSQRPPVGFTDRLRLRSLRSAPATCLPQVLTDNRRRRRRNSSLQPQF